MNGILSKGTFGALRKNGSGNGLQYQMSVLRVRCHEPLRSRAPFTRKAFLREGLT
jgi:hypothetical protein